MYVCMYVCMYVNMADIMGMDKWGSNNKIHYSNPQKGLRDSASFEPLSVQASDLYVGPTNKTQKCYNSPLCPEDPGTDFHQIW